MKSLSTFRLTISVLFLCLLAFYLTACSSVPTVKAEAGQIEITNIGLLACESPVEITLDRQGFSPITQRPIVANGRVIFSVGTGSNGVTVTGIRVIVPDNCEPGGYHGTYEYNGSGFTLVSGQTKELGWNEFDKK